MKIPLIIFVAFALGVQTSQAAPSSKAMKKLTALKSASRSEKWTFQVGYNEKLEYPIEQITGLVKPKGWTGEGELFVIPKTTSRSLPSHFDWREETGLTPIKDQGRCGSCWAFGTAAVLEQLIQIRDKNTKQISEQDLLSCNTRGWSCKGGWFAHDMHVNPGSVYESDFPYRGQQTACRKKLPYHEKIEDWAFAGQPGRKPTINEIKTAIHEYGPVAATLYAGSKFDNRFSAYHSGIFNASGGGQINHLVNLVGWDDDGGYWILRNSWGEGWGEKGYMRIKYGVFSIGDTVSFATYRPTCSPQPVVITGTDQTIHSGDTTLLGSFSISGQTYEWTPATGLDDPRSAMPIASPSQTTTYTLKVTNECAFAERSVKVIVQ